MRQDIEQFKKRMQSLKSYRELNPDKGYLEWKQAIEAHKDINTDDPDYDYKGFYKEDPDRANSMLQSASDAHFTDKYKTPSHPTFSIDSKYSNEQTPGGEWGNNTYEFSDYTYNHVNKTLDYLRKNDSGVTATYKGGAVLPEVTVTPKGNQIPKFGEGGEKEVNTPPTEGEFDPRWLKYLVKKVTNIFKNKLTTEENKPKKYTEFNIGAENYAKLRELKSAIDTLQLKQSDYINQELGRSRAQRAALLGETGVESYLKWDAKQIGGGKGEGYFQISDDVRKKDLRNFKPNFSEITTPYFQGMEQWLWFDKVLRDEQKACENGLLQYHHSNEWTRGHKESWKDNFKKFIDPNSTLQEISDGLRDGYIRPGKPDKETRDKLTELIYSILPDTPEHEIPSYDEGGEIGDPPVDPAVIEAINLQLGRDRTGRPLEVGLKPAVDLEDFANFTPAGDILALKDVYDGAANNNLVQAGLGALGILPFIPRVGTRVVPTVRRDTQRLIDEANELYSRRKRISGEYNDQLAATYNSLIENEDAFRRAVNADRFGSNYVDTYTAMLQDPMNPMLALRDTRPGQRAYVEAANPDIINISNDYVSENRSLEPGLVTHEAGHVADIKAGTQYTDQLGNKKKFVSEDKLKTMYPKSYKKIEDYLLNGSEIKSHMNEFRQYLIETGQDRGIESIRSFRDKLFKSDFNNLKKIYNSYKSKSQFIKDYNNVPIVATETGEARA